MLCVEVAGSSVEELIVGMWKEGVSIPSSGSKAMVDLRDGGKGSVSSIGGCVGAGVAFFTLENSEVPVSGGASAAESLSATAFSSKEKVAGVSSSLETWGLASEPKSAR